MTLDKITFDENRRTLELWHPVFYVNFYSPTMATLVYFLQSKVSNLFYKILKDITAIFIIFMTSFGDFPIFQNEKNANE